MISVLKELATSKKFLVTLVGLIVAAAARFGVNLDGPTILAFLGSVATYVLGQSITDVGKSAAVINQRTAQLRLASLTAIPAFPLDERGVVKGAV